MDLYLTLDYELFMGKETGTPENCLITPMEELLKIADKYKAKFVIFADAAYLLRMYQLMHSCPQLEKDFHIVSNNLRELDNLGHDIELHFHPQWLYSDYDNENNKWIMDIAHYKFSDMDSFFLNRSFRDSKAILDKIIGRETIAFRAGGNSLNSYPQYSSLLRDNHINIDSSVIGQEKISTKFEDYDYSKTPSNKNCWRFTNDVNVEESKGLITEHRITTSALLPGFVYLIKRIILEKRFGENKRWGDGKPSSLYLPFKDRFLELVMKFYRGKSFSASIDWISVLELPLIIDHCKSNKEDEIVVIGHPKNCSPQSLFYLDKFLLEYHDMVSFKTFR